MRTVVKLHQKKHKDKLDVRIYERVLHTFVSECVCVIEFVFSFPKIGWQMTHFGLCILLKLHVYKMLIS